MAQLLLPRTRIWLSRACRSAPPASLRSCARWAESCTAGESRGQAGRARTPAIMRVLGALRIRPPSSLVLPFPGAPLLSRALPQESPDVSGRGSQAKRRAGPGRPQPSDRAQKSPPPLRPRRALPRPLLLALTLLAVILIAVAGWRRHDRGRRLP